MQGCLWSRPPIDAERYIYVGDENKFSVEAIGTFRLLLKTSVYLIYLRLLLHRLLDGILFLFPVWTNMATLVPLEIIKFVSL